MYKTYVHIIICEVKTDQYISVNNILGLKLCFALWPACAVSDHFVKTDFLYTFIG